ncbi:SDR family NAD(P)-dependent oxidoreductase [Lignipirellula cremea]|uniref:Ketoacyl reductase n=1 Tax=Lignipirellula cremea TaxID=2528010 RepID=A0A518DPP9_9BACT|nr:SDR family NAD(P)-dependent oxidoreductase [Lignipirellula cremea]QDU93793.1 Putative ketoacyl reductase [Lignipirellula cremea]
MPPQHPITLVTGASRGIGRAIALGLAETGARVAVTARSAEELTELVDAIENQGGTAWAIPGDLIEKSATDQVVAAVEEHWGPIEILVNNAGIGSSSDPKPIVGFDDDFWELTLRLNVTVPYLLTKRVLPGMVAAGWGRIINIASINSKVASLHGSAYSASKHALAGLTKAAATEHAAHGVTVNAVCPGATATLMNDKRLEYDGERTGQTIAQLEALASPLGRRIQPDEIAAAAVFLASDGARAINGQLINVCGGRVMC